MTILEFGYVANIRSGSNTAALNKINKNMPESSKIKILHNKYSNIMIEQDHRFIKKITRPTLGFKAINSARAKLDGKVSTVFKICDKSRNPLCY